MDDEGHKTQSEITIGVIADTHGLLRPAALKALRGVDLILHAGDAGSAQVLDVLGALAPLQAIRGNVDRGPWALRLPSNRVVYAGPLLIYMLHDLGELDLDPAAAGFGAVIYGHSHQPTLERRGGVMYLNPGSAGPRRFNYPISLARLRLTGGALLAEFVDLEKEES